MLMTVVEWTSLLRQIEGLNPDEQLRLAALLVERARQHYRGPRLRWADAQGVAQPSLLGEDAQDWVSRIRRESDEARMISPDAPQ